MPTPGTGAENGVYSYQQLYGIALNAGFQPADASVMAAIALAESSGRVSATHTNSNGTVDRGLWQINSVHGGYNASQLTSDPAYNARAAFQIYKSQGYRAWTTYTSGAYRRYLGGASGPSGDFGNIANAANNSGVAQQIIDYASGFIGTPYQWGGESPKGFDCSGLVQYAFSHYGVNLPRTTGDQIHSGVGVSGSQAQAGDLLFPDTGHVMIYLGGGRALEAPHTGDHVKIIAYDPSKAVAIRRVLSGQAFAGMGPDSSGNASAALPAAANFDAALAQWGDGYQGLLKQNPDLHNWLFQVWQHNWDPNGTQAMQALQGTDFWKNHTPDEIKQMMSTANSQAGAQAQLPTLRDQVEQSALSWGVSLDNSQADAYAKDVMWGKVDPAVLDEQFKQQALSRYPGLSDQINRGITVKMAASPYVSDMSNLWETDASSIDYRTQPIIQQALQAQNKDGTPSVMPLWQYQQALKKDPRWLKTNNARDAMFSSGLQVLSDMGLSTTSGTASNFNQVGSVPGGFGTVNGGG